MTNTVPLLLIDVDGVLSPQALTKAARVQRVKRGFCEIEWRSRFVYPPSTKWTPLYSVALNRKHGEMLSRLSIELDIELAWGTLWASNANRIISPALGLPRLPYVDFWTHSSNSSSWKWSAVADFAAGRPLVWVDDGFGDAHARRAASGFDRSRRGLPTLLQSIDPVVGLRWSDIESIREWYRVVQLAW